MPKPIPLTPKDHILWLTLVSCTAGFFAAFIFAGFPQLDLSISSFFFHDHNLFSFNKWWPAVFARRALQWFFVGIALLFLSGLYFIFVKKQRPFGTSLSQIIFLISCLIVGPGLVTNVTFKDNWGRARPIHVEQFKGERKFTPVLQFSRNCPRNCSFVSGESSSIFMIFFALALAFPAFKAIFYGYAIGLGGLASLLRIGAGGHFMSDVLFSAVFMMLTAAGLYWLIFYSRWAEKIASWEPDIK